MPRSLQALAVFVIWTLVGALPTADGAELPLARWKGGELSVARFLEEYDPDGELLRSGGADLESAVCKASFLEIYRPLALAAGLDRDPEMLAELAAWQERHLAALYRRRHAPSAPIGPEELRLAYEAGVAVGRFERAASADLEVLFVRCAGDDLDRTSCRARVGALSRRLEAGEAFENLVAEEKARSGGASGAFRNLPVAQLAPELRRAVSSAVPGEVGEPVELATGIARLRLIGLRPGETLPFDAVRQALARDLAAERLARWEADQIVRWRGVLGDGIPEEAAPDAVLAAAARAEALHQEAVYLAAERSARSFALADRAFLLDREVLPSDDQLLEQLHDPVRGAAHRRLTLAVAVAPATSDGADALRLVRTIADDLQGAVDPAAVIAAAAEEVAGLVIRQIGPLTAAELGAAWPAAGGLLERVGRDGWAGPVGVVDQIALPGGAVLPVGAAVLVLHSSEVPPLDDVRDQLYRQLRYRIGALEPFQEVMGRRWRFELLSEALRPWPETALAAIPQAPR